MVSPLSGALGVCLNCVVLCYLGREESFRNAA
jgi:hypothetical protein